MPFVSKSQARACYHQKRTNPKSTWDCDEWSRKTNWKTLPETANKRRSTKRSKRRSTKRSKRRSTKRSKRRSFKYN